MKFARLMFLLYSKGNEQLNPDPKIPNFSAVPQKCRSPRGLATNHQLAVSGPKIYVDDK